MHRFLDIARYWSKIAVWIYPASTWPPVGDDPVGNSRIFFASKN